MKKITSSLFYVINKDTYPPFKNGLYMEEYFLDYIEKNNIKFNKTYIPVLWTNFQIEDWFPLKKEEMQSNLDLWIKDNYNENGYFTIVQHDDGPLLKLPENTIIYGACSGDIPLPLIYQDINNTLENIPKKKYKDKSILCSFVGCKTHLLRTEIINTLKINSDFKFIINEDWTPAVNKLKQNNFIETTILSKFALAPRGYGRSSFRFIEIFKLGTIPIYVWNDIEWLPYKDILNYNDFCISINIKDIKLLPDILNNIDEERWNLMMKHFNKIKYYFELDGMSEYIITSLTHELRSFDSLLKNIL